jgi:hypothetical protein
LPQSRASRISRRKKIAFFLLDRIRRCMPNFPLSRSEAADLAAYIGSPRK